MDEQRLDELLDAALVAGHVPAEASPEEAAEIARLLAAAETLRAPGRAIAAEAAEVRPAARERFERYIATSAASAAPSQPVSKRGRLAAVVTRPKRMALLAASLAVILMLAAVGGIQLVNRGAETAAALTPGDYVELEGVVSATPGPDGSVRVASEVGALGVDLSEETSLVEGMAPVGRETLVPGRGVVVSGTVDEHGRIAAHAITVREQERRPPPQGGPLRPFEGQEAEGTIIAVSVGRGGEEARVTVLTAGGETLVAVVDGATAEELLELGNAVGSRVGLSRGPQGGPPAIDVREPGGEEGGIARYRGIVTAHSGPILELETADGTATVSLAPHTRVLVGGRAISIERVLGGEESLTGRMVTVGGGVEPGNDRIAANVVVIGRDRR